MLIDINSFVNKKLEEHLNVINLLKKEIAKNKISLKNNKEDINLLRNKILILYHPELIEFNKKYYLNIKDINIERLDLSSRYIGNDGMKYLEKIKFKEIKELNLSNNNISDIKLLEKVKFEQLEKLYLCENVISNNINILENVNVKK